MTRISREYHAHAGRYQSGGNSCDYIVVHNTGNSASALAEARNQQNNFSRPAGAHYFLDGGGTIYQLLDDTDTAWAVGAWSGARQLISNFESISIEVCSDGTEFTDAEIEELTWLVQLLMERHDIPARNVVRHWDCHTGRKECPAWYVPMNRWYTLHKTITEGDDMRPADVWEYDYKRTAPKGNMYNCLTDVHKMLEHRRPADIWEYNYKNSAPGGNMYSCMLQMHQKITDNEKKVAALDKKLDAILKALG